MVAIFDVMPSEIDMRVPIYDEKNGMCSTGYHDSEVVSSSETFYAEDAYVADQYFKKNMGVVNCGTNPKRCEDLKQKDAQTNTNNYHFKNTVLGGSSVIGLGFGVVFILDGPVAVGSGLCLLFGIPIGMGVNSAPKLFTEQTLGEWVHDWANN